MEKPFVLDKVDDICQEPAPNINIDALRNECAKEKDEAIQHILNQTNYGNLMKDFVQDAGCNVLYLRMADDVYVSLKDFTLRDINHAVSNTFYSTGGWCFHDQIVIGYAKKGKVTPPPKTPNWGFSYAVGLWVAAFVCLLILFALFLGVEIPAYCINTNVLLNVVSVVLCFAVIGQAFITFIVIPWCSNAALKSGMMEEVSMATINTYPLVQYTAPIYAQP